MNGRDDGLVSSSQWPLEPIFWTSPTLQNGKLITSSTRIRVMEVYGNRNLLISTEVPDCSAQRTESKLASQQNPSMTSSRGPLSSRLSNRSSPSRSPKMSRSEKAGINKSLNSGTGEVNKSSVGGTQRRRAPGFVSRPRSQSIFIGKKLSLKCSLLGHPKPTVTWEKDGELVDEDKTQGHIRTSIDDNDYQLLIEKVSFCDGGKYAVTARNSLGKQTATINVEVKGDDPHQEKNLNFLSENDRFGKSVKNATGARVVPSGIASNSYENIFHKSGSESLIKNTKIPSQKPPIKVEEQVKVHPVVPTFLQRLSSVQVIEGEELLLQCEIAGNPDPSLSWTRNGIEVGIEEDEIFTSYREGVARLRLRDVRPLHAGEYVCIAENDGGTVQCSSRVTVKARKIEMKPRFLKAPPDFRVSEGETLIIEAEVDGNPIPEIVWSLDGEEISDGETSYRKNIAKLTLHNVTSSHSGQYMCSALNSHGEDSVACRVRVRRQNIENPPQFLSHLSNITVEEDNDVTLSCTIANSPDLCVEWMYNQEVITSEDGVNIFFKNGIAKLVLEQATQEDSGFYTCVATNSAGQSFSECKVMVEEKDKFASLREIIPPEFVIPFDEFIRVQEGDTLDLECEISGFPQPEVIWTINDKKIDNGKTNFEGRRATLSIAPITSNHGGYLRCRLNNPAGEASYQARIYVRSKRVAPSFEKFLPEVVEIFEGKEAYFNCKVKGHPQPRVVWTRDGRSLSVLSAETSYEDGLASVRIRKSSPRDAGKYKCMARNLSGEAESCCQVIFVENVKTSSIKYEAPAIPLGLDDVELNDGDDLRLNCHVSGYPTPEVTWKVGGEIIHPEDGVAKIDGGIASLFLEDMMVEDSGEYECVAVNPAGRAASSCRVLVSGAATLQSTEAASVPPHFTSPLSDCSIREGENLFLKCRVAGLPQPEVTWKFDGRKIEENETKYYEDGTAVMVVNSVLPKHGGRYTCVATNFVNCASSSCIVSIKRDPASLVKPLMQKYNFEATSAVKDDAALPTVDKAEKAPIFMAPLKDAEVEDGSTNFCLSCQVSGNPTAKWFFEGNEIANGDEFQLVSVGDVRKLVLAEVFPDDEGEYTCVVKNKMGEAKCSCMLTIQEIDGEPPVFILKPKPMTIVSGEKATFTCRVYGEPTPLVRWMFRNSPIEDYGRYNIIEGNSSNSYTYSLEILNASGDDAGKYSVTCKNLLGDVTCTISLIVDAAKKQQTRKDFRDVLKKSPLVKNPTNKTIADENVDFRSLLRKKSSDKDADRKVPESSSLLTGIAFKEVLSTSVKTKALTEEERKLQKADQIDFRGNLLRKVDTKLITQDALRGKEGDQIDFRKEAIKTKVKTKAIAQDELRLMHPEQKDFRTEAIKSKVTTKAYKEEVIKAKRAEQVDFRNLLSPTKREEIDKFKFDSQEVTIAHIPRSKWRKEVDHTIVATKRTRHRGAPALITDKKESFEDSGRKEPEFTKKLMDIKVRDGDSFQLECQVVGSPPPKIAWFFEEDPIDADSDVIITQRGSTCCLGVEKSFPEDQGHYKCLATNLHGTNFSSCYVTVIEDAN